MAIQSDSSRVSETFGHNTEEEEEEEEEEKEEEEGGGRERKDGNWGGLADQGCYSRKALQTVNW